MKIEKLNLRVSLKVNYHKLNEVKNEKTNRSKYNITTDSEF